MHLPLYGTQDSSCRRKLSLIPMPNWMVPVLSLVCIARGGCSCGWSRESGRGMARFPCCLCSCRHLLLFASSKMKHRSLTPQLRSALSWTSRSQSLYFPGLLCLASDIFTHPDTKWLCKIFSPPLGRTGRRAPWAAGFPLCCVPHMGDLESGAENSAPFGPFHGFH